MEGEGRLKLIVAGLVLAAFAVGYFILAQRFQTTSPTSTPRPTPISQANIVIASPSPSASPVALGQNNQIGGGTDLPNTGVSALPKTGFPLPVGVAFTVAAMISGWFLRRYPN